MFTEIPYRQTLLLAMRNGDIDGTFDLAISGIEQWQALDNADVITYAFPPQVNFLMLDQSTTPSTTSMSVGPSPIPWIARARPGAAEG